MSIIVGIFFHLFSDIPAGLLSVLQFVPAIRNVSIVEFVIIANET